MRRYSEAVKADVRRRMGPPHRQSLAAISQELGIHVITLYKWLARYRSRGHTSLADRRSVRRTQRRTLDPQQLQQALKEQQS
jgi:transposase-like protein